MSTTYAPPPRSALVGPVACGVLGVASLTVLAVTDRSAAGVPCPFHAVTGLWCPGCGLTRGVRALLDGDVAVALGHNVLLPVVLVGLVAGWWMWLTRALGRSSSLARRIAALPTVTWVGCAVGVVAFTVLRNLPVGAALAP